MLVNRYRLTPQEMRAPVRVAIRQNACFRALPFLSVCSFCGGIIAHYLAPRINIVGELFGAGLFFAFFWLLLPLLTQWQLGRHPLNHVEITWFLDDEGFRYEGEGFNGAMHWPRIHKVVQTKSGFLIFPQGSVFHWIPNHGFAASENIKEMETLLLRTRVPVRRV